MDKKSITEIGKPRQMTTTTQSTSVRPTPGFARQPAEIPGLPCLVTGNYRTEYGARYHRAQQAAIVYDYDRSRVMTLVPAALQSGWGGALAPVGAGIPVLIGEAGMAFPVFEFMAFEFPARLMLSRVPVVLVVLGTPITVGLMPVGGQGLAGSGKKDRCHENA